MNYPPDAEFLNYNPRIVLLRQSGNTSFIRYIGGVESGSRQTTKRFAYTKYADGNSVEFLLESPCAQRFGNYYSFCLMTTDNNGDFENYYTIDEYIRRYASVKSIGGNGGGLIMLTAEKGGITLPGVNGITEVRLKRGGLPARKFTFVSGNLSEAGGNYASTVIGFQLVTDAGCSNIVYLNAEYVKLAEERLII
jgi:hypothetical protein